MLHDVDEHGGEMDGDNKLDDRDNMVDESDRELNDGSADG